METLEQIASRIAAAIPDAKATVIANAPAPGQASLLLGDEHAAIVATFLRDDAALKLDYCSNVTGIDWPERVVKTTVKSMQVVDGVEKEVATTREETQPGYLEAVYHLYSMSLKHGPVIIRLRTADRAAGTHVPSLTPVWKCRMYVLNRSVSDNPFGAPPYVYSDSPCAHGGVLHEPKSAKRLYFSVSEPAGLDPLI